jgi:GAG-pre-integrase domain
MNLAHRRLGHISESRVKALALGQAKGLKLLSSGYRPSKCDHCITGKIKILSYPRKQPTLRRAIKLMEILYIDLL